MTVEDRVASEASGAASAREGGAARLIASARRISPDTWAMVAVAGAVVAANLPYLLGLLDPNPLGPRSGLLSALTPGFIRGQPMLDPNNGFISQALSHRAMLDLVHLHLPWWNPYEATGTPLAGELQFAWFSHATVNPARFCQCCCSASSGRVRPVSPVIVAAGG